MFEPEVVDVLDGRLDVQVGEGVGLEVFEGLEVLDVVVVHVHVSHHVDQLSPAEASHLRHQTGQ